MPPKKSPLAVTVLTTTERLLAEMERVSERAEEITLAYAWIGGAGRGAPHWEALDLEKVRRAVIGVHFNQTEPEALRALHERRVLRVNPRTDGVFHPKLLLARRGSRTWAFVGSSNFTAGGYGKNVELNVLLEGASEHPEIRALRRFVDDQWERCEARFDMEAWLKAYAREYAKRPRPRPTLAPRPERPGQPPGAISALDIGWREYLSLIKGQEERELADGSLIFVWGGDWSYLRESEVSEAAFRRNRRFARIPLEERKVVTGWGKGGWFGAMRSAGHFKAIVADEPQLLGHALDRLPLRGRVKLELAAELIDEFCEIDYVGLSGATRLLAMKRPDVFFCANKANKQQMDEAFGHPVTTRSGYLAALERIWAFPWAAARKPKAKLDLRIWRARVALLDALFYDGRAAR